MTAIAEEFTVAIELKNYQIPKGTEALQVTLINADGADPVFLTDHFDTDGVVYWHGPLVPEDLKNVIAVDVRFVMTNETNRVRPFQMSEVDLQITRVADLEESSSGVTGPDPDVARDDEGPSGPVDPDVAVDG